jgi:hypothetical protein
MGIGKQFNRKDLSAAARQRKPVPPFLRKSPMALECFLCSSRHSNCRLLAIRNSKARGRNLREARHRRVHQVMGTLASKYRGYWNYYGVIGNFKSLGQFYELTKRVLFKWLNGRSQRGSFNWAEFIKLLNHYQIPKPKIWEKVSCSLRFFFCDSSRVGADFL